MKKHVSRMAVVMAMLLSVASLQVASYGFPPKAPKAAKARGRVPANYAKLDLDEEQKTKIYDVQAKYKEQIDALNQQLKDLRAKEMQEVSEVLTAAQKTKLAEIEAAAAKEKLEKAIAAKAARGKKAEEKKADKAEEKK